MFTDQAYPGPRSVPMFLCNQMHPGIKADQAYLAHALSSAHRSVIPSIDMKVVKAGATGAHKLINSLYS